MMFGLLLIFLPISAAQGAWNCTPEYFNSSDGCDCDCGVWDPDCLQVSELWGCPPSLPGSKPICLPSGICSTVNLTVPQSWSCPAESFNSSDGCDCECGAFDPDCLDPLEPLFGCAADQSSCSALGICVRTVPLEWLCFPAYYNSSDGCDCNCGIPDPDCKNQSAPVSNCPCSSMTCQTGFCVGLCNGYRVGLSSAVTSAATSSFTFGAALVAGIAFGPWSILPLLLIPTEAGNAKDITKEITKAVIGVKCDFDQVDKTVGSQPATICPIAIDCILLRSVQLVFLEEWSFPPYFYNLTIFGYVNEDVNDVMGKAEAVKDLKKWLTLFWYNCGDNGNYPFPTVNLQFYAVYKLDSRPMDVGITKYTGSQVNQIFQVASTLAEKKKLLNAKKPYRKPSSCGVKESKMYLTHALKVMLPKIEENAPKIAAVVIFGAVLALGWQQFFLLLGCQEAAKILFQA